MSATDASTFRRPLFTALPSKDAAGQDISSIPDLIRFNSTYNPDHIFCIQSLSNVNESSESFESFDGYLGDSITFKQLDKTVRRCAEWLRDLVDVSAYEGTSGPPGPPVALYLESDVGLFFHFMALQVLNIPVLLISARLSPQSVQHLLEKTKSCMLLVTKRTFPLLDGKISQTCTLRIVSHYKTFLQPHVGGDGTEVRYAPSDEAQEAQTTINNTRRDVILHSSGTTGFPKPIYLTKRYLLQYAACHEFPPSEELGWLNLSTLPLYHGFGLLAPGLSLSIGLKCCFPPSSVIPAGKSTFDLLMRFGCRSLMTVPSIIDDLIEVDGALGQLAQLEFLAVGGGALSLKQGICLQSHGVSLLNHYGVSEIGAIAHIFRPGPDYDWRYLRLRSDLSLELRPVPGSPHFRLIGYPVGWNETFEVQDALELNPNTPPGRLEVRIVGRTDDVIVLKTGEKVMPQHMESVLNADPSIKTAVCIGQGRFEIAVLVEPANATLHDGPRGDECFLDTVWNLVSAANATIDRHAQVSSRRAIILKPKHKAIPRTDKGSVSRREVHELFADEIDAAYTALELELPSTGLSLPSMAMEDIFNSVRGVVTQVFAHASTLDSNDDFFEHGMDSLQAVRLSRLLSTAIKQDSTTDPLKCKLDAEFIYRNPTVTKLSSAISARMQTGQEHQAERHGLNSCMTGLVETFSARQKCDSHILNSVRTKGTHAVLLTGVTGNLGAHTLGQLLETPSVKKVICLYRQTKVSLSSEDGSRTHDKGATSALDRLKSALGAGGITVHPTLWDKVELVGSAEFVQGSMDFDVIAAQSPSGSTKLKARNSVFRRLSGEVTHIVHLAWPMDFQLTLESFQPHLLMLEALLRLARCAYVSHSESCVAQPVRMIFSSSIASVRNYRNTVTVAPTQALAVPEVIMDSPATAAPMGYAQAKWVCESILNAARHEFGEQVEPVVVRVGQLSGPEQYDGVWKLSEHIPTLVKASTAIGAFPRLHGKVSWLPVDRAARSLVEMTLYPRQLSPVLHLENPIRVLASDILTIISHELKLTQSVSMSFEQWLKRVNELNALGSLSSFFDKDFRDLALGEVVLDTVKARAVSPTLRGSSGIERALIIRYVQRWQQQGLFGETGTE